MNNLTTKQIIDPILKLYQDKNYKDTKKESLKLLKKGMQNTALYNVLGLIYLKEYDFVNAKKMYQKAISIDNQTSQLYLNLGNVYLEEQDYNKAEELYYKSIELGSNTYLVYHNLAKLYMAINEHAKALNMFQKALELNITNSDLLFEYSLFCLGVKDYLNGFNLYRYRYNKNKTDRQTYLISDYNLLEKGIDINNKVIFLTNEQGYGDIVQFIRYAPMFEKMGAKVYVQTKKLLYNLFKNSYPSINFLKEDEMVRFDYHLPLMNAAYFFGTKYETIPFGDMYLSVNKEDSLKSFNKFFKNETKKKIGIVWRSNAGKNESFSKEKERANRNINLEDFLKYFNVLDVQLYSLQVDITRKERLLLDENHILSLGDELINFYDNALIIDNLDALIGIDTISIIIAGAMGKETVVMLPSYSDWRWTRTGVKTNWFNSIYISRQKSKGNWKSVFEDVITYDHIFSKINSIENMISKATAHHQSGMLKEAEKLYKEILEIDSSNASAFHFLGLIAYQTGHTKQAIELIQQSITLNPEYDEAYYNLELITKSFHGHVHLDKVLGFKIGSLYQEDIDIQIKKLQKIYDLFEKEGKLEITNVELATLQNVFSKIFTTEYFDTLTLKRRDAIFLIFFKFYSFDNQNFNEIFESQVKKIVLLYISFNYNIKAQLQNKNNTAELKNFFERLTYLNSLILKPLIQNYFKEEFSQLLNMSQKIKENYFKTMTYLVQNSCMYWYTTIRDALDTGFISKEYVLLINDTSDFYHPGCKMTSIGIKNILHDGFDIIVDIPIHEIYTCGSILDIQFIEDFDNSVMYEKFKNEFPIMEQKLAYAKEIVINGEGTLHNKPVHVTFLLYLAYIAKTRYLKKVSIVNHSPYPSYSNENRNAIVDEMYKRVYEKLDFVGIREPVAKKLMDTLAIDSTLTFDCSSIYLDDIDQGLLTNVTPYNDYIVLSASVIVTSQIESIFSKVIKYFLQEGENIVLFNGGPNEEKVFLENIYSNFKDEKRVSFVEAQSIEHFLSVIKYSTIMISGRFHYSIIALFLQRPFIILSSNTFKNVGLLEMVKLSNKIIEFQTNNLYEEIILEFQKMLLNIDDYILKKEELNTLVLLVKRIF